VNTDRIIAYLKGPIALVAYAGLTVFVCFAGALGLATNTPQAAYAAWQYRRGAR
jgi:hypothetical protein